VALNIFFSKSGVLQQKWRSLAEVALVASGVHIATSCPVHLASKANGHLASKAKGHLASKARGLKAETNKPPQEALKR